MNLVKLFEKQARSDECIVQERLEFMIMTEFFKGESK